MDPGKKYNRIALVLAVALVITGGFFVFQEQALAAAGINKQVNFQGKVVNTDGTNVANNSYNFLFCIYTTASPATPCTAGANNDAIWKESKSLTVTDGIFQTNLGDTIALPGSVDFNTDNIYLGIRFNSDTTEMTPRIQFTAAPYAFNADNLDGKDWTNPGTIGASANTLALASGGTSSWTNTIGNLTISTATSGTLALTSAGALNLSAGAASYFNTSAGDISFQVAGTGTIGTLQIGAGGAGSTTPDLLGLDVKSTTSDPAGGFEGAMYYNTYDNKFRCYQGSGWTDCIGTGGAGPWTDGSGITYLTDTAEDFAVGGSALASPFSIDVSGNIVRIGDADTTNDAYLDMYAADGDTGTIQYTTNDSWYFNGGNVGIGTASPIRKLHLAYSTGAAEQIWEVQDGMADNRKWNLIVSGGTGAAQNLTFRTLNDAGTAATKDNVLVLAGSTGNVGIGTTSPGGRLDVSPTVTATSDLKGTLSGLVYNGASAMTNYYGHYIAAPTGTGTITNKYALVTEANAGNVGIGTTSPGAKFQVVDSQGTDVPVQVLTNNGNANFMQGNHALAPNIGTGNHFAGYVVGKAFSARNAAYLGFYYAGAGSTSNYLTLGGHSVDDALVVRMDGNVGIGMTAPVSVLHAKSNFSGGGATLTLENASATGDVSIDFKQNGVFKSNLYFSSAGGYFGINDTNQNLIINKNGGNVGINTTGPDRRLDILDASNPQLRLTYTDGSIYSDLQTGANGGLALTGSSLTVNGAIGFSNSFTIANATGSASQYGEKLVLTSTGSTAATLYGKHISFVDATSTANTVYGLYVDASTANASDTQYAAAFMNGNVGIGTATPTSKLTIQSTTDSASLGTEMSPNVEFTGNANGWTLGLNPPPGISPDWYYNTDKVSHANGGGTATLEPSTPLTVTAGASYLVSFDLTGYSAGSVTASIGGANGQAVSYDVTSFKQVIVANNTTNLKITPTNTFVGNIDNVSAKLITTAPASFTLANAGGTNTPVEFRSGGDNLRNTFIGLDSGKHNTTGNDNSAMGNYALRSNTTGNDNAAMGNYALFSNTTGNQNAAIGYAALRSNTTGYLNSAMGNWALYSNTTGIQNSAMGDSALFSNTTGNYNSAQGVQALLSNTTGNDNTALGYNAGRYQADGSTALASASQSVYIGSGARGYNNSDANSIVIGYQAIGIGANSVVLGNNSIVTTALKGSVGINTTGPDRKLDILDASNPQLRLTYTDGSIYSDLQTGASGGVALTGSGLTANGAIGLSNSFTIANATGSASQYGEKLVLTSTGSTASTIYGKHISFVDATSTANTVYGLYVDASTANASDTQYAAAFMNGNVGIGTATPSDKLNVSSSSGVTGIDGTQIDFETTGTTASADNSGLRVNVTSNNSGATTTLEGVDIANLVSAETNSTETALRIGTGWDTGISVGSGGITIATGTAYTGSGTVTLSSGTASALTIDSGTTGDLNIGTDASGENIYIGTGAAVKTLVIGSTNTTSPTTIQSGTGGIKIAATGSTVASPVKVQIGKGTGSTSPAGPNFLRLDVKGETGDPTGSAGINGSMYYNSADGKFRCYENNAWKDCIGASGGTPGGADTNIQFNDGGTTFGGEADFTWDKTTNTLALEGTDTEIDLMGVTNEPSTPPAANLYIYSKSIAGRIMPKWKSPTGFDTPFQAFLGFNGVRQVAPASGTTASTCMQAFGTAFTNTATTIVQVTPTIGSVLNQVRRVTLATSTTSANVAFNRANVLEVYRGDAAGRGGFFYSVRFALAGTLRTGNRAFFGLVSTISDPTNVDPTTSTALSRLGMGINASTGNWNIIESNGTNIQSTTLGANFPVNTTSLLELVLFSASNGSDIGYRVTDLSMANQTSGTLSTYIPSNTTFLAPTHWITNNTNTTASTFGLNKWYLESDY